MQGGHIQISVRSLQTQRVRLQHTQVEYNPAELYGLRGFAEDLSEAQRTTLRQFYDGCNPRPMRDLLRGDEEPLTIGPAEFRCSPDDLLCGLIETLYSMRNALLHGEVDPDAPGSFLLRTSVSYCNAVSRNVFDNDIHIEAPLELSKYRKAKEQCQLIIIKAVFRMFRIPRRAGTPRERPRRTLKSLFHGGHYAHGPQPLWPVGIAGLRP